MASMFGQSRYLGFSPTLGAVSPAGVVGYGPGLGSRQLSDNMVVPTRSMGGPGVFSAHPDVAFSGPQESLNDLRAINGMVYNANQSEKDRELNRVLQQRELANKLGLANIDQATQFGVQDRRNTGALDQINASGGWERTIQGDRLGSAERLAQAQRALDEMQMRGGWEQQGLDRGSREKLGFAEMQNALQRQQMVNSGALDQIGAEGDVRTNLQRMVGDQNANLQTIQDQGAFNRALLGERGATGRLGMELKNRGDLTDREIAGRLQQQRMMDTAAGQRLGQTTASNERISQWDVLSRAADRTANREDNAADRGVRLKAIEGQFGTPEERARNQKHAETLQKLDVEKSQIGLAIVQANQAMQAARNPFEKQKMELELKTLQQAAANNDLERGRIEAETGLLKAQAAKFNADARTPVQEINDAAGNPALANQLGIPIGDQLRAGLEKGTLHQDVLKTIADDLMQNQGYGKGTGAANRMDFSYIPGRNTPGFLMGSSSDAAGDELAKIVEEQYGVKLGERERNILRQHMALPKYGY